MTNKAVTPAGGNVVEQQRLQPLVPEPDKLNTGTAGFDIDGKVYTFDPGVDDSQGGAQGNVDHGNVKVDDRTKDLSRPTKKTLADYLSDVTLGKKGSSPVPNRYPIDRSPRPELSTTDEKGNPSPKPALSENDSSFAADVIDSYSQQYPSIKGDIKKGKASSTGIDGNDLLHQQATGPVVTRYTSAVLSNNRFMPDGAHMITTDPAQPDPGYDPSLVRGKTLGSSAGGDAVAMGRLATIGPTLTLRAGIELGSGQAGFDPNSTAATAGAILPGVAQLAVRRIDQVMLNAKDVLDSLTSDETTNYVSPGSLSWGALNNTEDQWSGIAALGMATLSTAMVAGLLLVIDGLSLILGLIKPGTTAPTHDSQGRYALGQYYAGQKPASGGLLGAVTALLSLDIGALLGIQPTFFPFPAALKKGSSAFFGIDDSAGILGQIGGAAAAGLGPDAGYNVVVARSIIRSTLTISDALSKIGGNPINVIKSILNLIDVLKTSKIIAACNIFAQLGDAILTIPPDWTDPVALGGQKISRIDASLDESAISRNRLPGTLKLAWSSNRSRANLLVSQNVGAVSRIAKKMGSFDTHAGLNDLDGRIQTSTVLQDAVPRIDPDAAAAFELQLDAEYVPFYFHDLRTNEMVGFHAFLSSLTDDYAASYESVDAYGRVEPIKIYKGTARRLGMSFYIVSTSPQDFNDMWVKINKLTTLLYPQFTAGKLVQDEAGQFIFTQPFSQLIGASPMIRLRLGDLIRSNYSRFNLARLFGLGNTNFTLEGKTFSNFSKFDADAVASGLSQKIETFKSTAGKTFLAAHKSNGYVLAKSSAGGIGLPMPPLLSSGGDPQNAPTFSPTGNPDFFEIKIVKEDPDHPENVIGEIQVTTDPEYLQTLSDVIVSINKEFGDSSKPSTNVIGGQYVFGKQDLMPSQKTHDQAVDDLIALAEDPFATTLATFMDPSMNVVVQSFKNTGGKGLAGFIETMNFDWFDKVTWETGIKGHVAPKMCKVTLTFVPVHDITPGLDHLGVNRAPIYPVGQMGPRAEPQQR